ncbi:MAG: glycosyltransferase [Candidatus Omnitrophica bacterium]|nr:glycosyltransferase [Candidatus Omnitrophota bacterium]
MPYFSIIIPTYNRSDFLKKAVASVLNQSFKDFELIIIDDGSEDETESFIRTINDPRLKYIKQPHQGVSFSRNSGVKAATGSFICFLDSDDWFKPDKLKKTYDYIKRYPEYKIFHTEEIWYRNKELLTQKTIHKKPDGYVFKNALKLCCISISTAAISREIFTQIGMFDENLPACEDYDFWLRVSAEFPVKLIPEFMTEKKGGHQDQLSKKHPAMDKFRIYSIKKIIDNNRLSDEQRLLAVKELERKCIIYIKGAKKRDKSKEVAYYQNIIDKHTR